MHFAQARAGTIFASLRDVRVCVCVRVCVFDLASGSMAWRKAERSLMVCAARVTAGLPV